MKLKHLVVLPAMLFVLITKAQTGTFDKINIRSSLKLQDKIITEISTDTSLISSSDSKIPTERAVKNYIDNYPTFIKKAGGGIIKENDSLYLGGAYENLFLSASLDGYGNYYQSSLDGWQMGTYRPEGQGGILSMDNLGYCNLNFEVYDNSDHATYVFSKDSFCIQDKNSILGNPQRFTFYRDGRLKLYNFKNTVSGLNFLSTDANGYLKFNPLKKGNGISSIGDSLYLGGNFSEINLSHKDGQSYFNLGDENFYVQTSNGINGHYSRFEMGTGATFIRNYSGVRETQLTIYQNEFAYNDGIMDRFKIDGDGVTNIQQLKVTESFKLNVFHSLGDQLLLNYGACVVVLDDLTQNETVDLPDPALQEGRIYYLFNANTSATYSYTINYPIYKSGNVSYTSIPGNSEFRAMIVSDGTKWLQLN